MIAIILLFIFEFNSFSCCEYDKQEKDCLAVDVFQIDTLHNIYVLHANHSNERYKIVANAEELNRFDIESLKSYCLPLIDNRYLWTDSTGIEYWAGKEHNCYTHSESEIVCIDLVQYQKLLLIDNDFSSE